MFTIEIEMDEDFVNAKLITNFAFYKEKIIPHIVDLAYVLKNIFKNK